MAPTILVVDDSSLVRDVTSSILRGAGFEVIEGATGADALRLASRRPELIVLDVHLPDLDGREVCRQIKAHPATAAIPVLHLSGTFREVEDRVRGLELGADGYLTKPVGKAELLATVNALLRVRKVEADLGQSEGRRRTAEALVDVGRALAQSLDPGEVGQRITEGLRGLFGAEVATLYRMEPESGNLVSVAMAGNAGSDGQGVVMPRGTGVSGLAVIGRTAVVTADATTDPRVTLSPETRARLERAPFRAVLAVPLLVQDRVIGALAVGDRAGRQFGPEDLRLAQAFATQAALALENARLYAQRAHAEEALRESQETLRAVIDAIPVMINAKDRDCRYVLMNSFQARIYGIAPEAAVGRTATELRGPVYGTYTEALDRQVLTSGAALPYFEESYPDAQGVVHTWLTTKVPLGDGAGSVRGVATIALDLSDRKLLEEQLRQAQKMEAVGRLAGGVAHDFNNLLTVIGGRGELLRARLPADSPLGRHVDLILETAERAAALTRQLLAFSRKQVLRPKLLDLRLVVAGMETMLRRLIGETIELVTVAEERVGLVRADPGQVEQVILNLAINARDAMPHGGRLVLTTANVELDGAFVRQHPGARAGSYVSLTVSDTGTGISPEVAAHLFEPFYTTKGVGRGTGLGLATVYGIVKQSEGYIAVSSEPGRGARFDIYLPRVEGTLAGDDGSPDPHPPQRGHETILLVEDQDEVRDLARDLLQAGGYTVLEARQGAEALRLWEEHAGQVHLLLTDVVMPQVGGRELADRLTAIGPGLRVLYMSGYADEALGEPGVLDARRAFLHKPFTSTTLLTKVRDLLDGGHAP